MSGSRRRTSPQIPRYADHSRETFDAALDTCEKIATDLFAPHNKKSDANEPHFDGETVSIIPEVSTALRAFCDAGLMAAGQDYEYGGMQLPVTLEKAAFAYFKAANVGTEFVPVPDHRQRQPAAHARHARRRSTPLSAPNSKAASSARCACRSRRRARRCRTSPRAADYEGESPLGQQYRLRGNKMWISAGEHELSENIVHLVLAKIPGPDGKLIPGVKGISLFIVPKYLVNGDGSLGEHNDVALAGLNHKMGYRGTTNCLLNFGEGMRYRPDGKAGAIGYLVGEPAQGPGAACST